MDPTTATDRVARMRRECASLGRELVQSGHRLTPEEAFELAGQAQRLANAADGLVMAFGAFGARVETPSWETGVETERVHGVGFVDAMAPAEMSLATGVTEGLAGRKVTLGAALAARFPRLRDLVLSGEVPAASAHKVVDACAGLDDPACAAVDGALAPRLPTMDPARVARAAREVAGRVAADQVAAQQERTRRGRTVQVRGGDDGLTEWWALLPTEASVAMAAAVDELATEYRAVDSSLTMSEARADALSDLVLENVTVSAKVTLGVPVITDTAPPEPGGADGPQSHRVRVDWDDDDTVVDHATGVETRYADLAPASREELSWVEVPVDDAVAPDPRPCGQALLPSGAAVSGADLPGVGFLPASVMANLLTALPLDVARAVLEADTGTLTSVTSRAYTPPAAMRELVTTRDGTCRMWGCSRPAVRADLDHVDPWPGGETTPVNLAGLCRRHHRLKHRGRWRYLLAPDGTVTWIGPRGQTRTTEPQHRVVARSEPPPHRPPHPPPAGESAAKPPALSSVAAPPF
jgi:hypothetical protein